MLKPDWPGRIAGNEGHDRIAACLTLDIQTAPEAAQMVLEHLDDVTAGRVAQQKLVMNAYVLEIAPERCVIAPLYPEHGEKTLQVGTEEFRTALMAWINQIASHLD